MSTTKYGEGDESHDAVKGNRADEELNLTKTVLQPGAEPEQGAPKDSDYDDDDEAMIRSRLEALGYL